MRYQLTDDEQAISDLARQILTDTCTHQRLRAMEQSGDQIATDVWRALAEADLLGIGLPDDVGGAGYDMVGAALVLEQVGATVAPVPYLATIVLGAMPIARFGDEAQRALLAEIIAGDVLCTAALLEGIDVLPAARPATVAAPGADGGWVIDGTKAFVPWGDHADLVLVSAATGDGASTILLVAGDAPGLVAEPVTSTTGEPLATLRFEGVTVGAEAVLGEVGGGAEVLAWLEPRAVTAVCATAAGICEGALALLASYTSERKQFDVPIATFQAVAHRAADAYIDTNAVVATARQAAWRISAGLDADDAVDIAKVWTAEGGQRVVHAAQHLHGGIGVDIDYPLHRYFRAAKMAELTFGGAHEHLGRLGARIAASV